MKKTISLKLTKQEENLINSMRNKGISTSTIIRQALHKYFKENNIEKHEKKYKVVNQIFPNLQENEKNNKRKVNKWVNQQNQRVNHAGDFLREKMVYQPVNHVTQSQTEFLDQFIYLLQRRLQQLDSELGEWKRRYVTETQYWKETYQSLLKEYQNNIVDSTKRIDDRFDQIMFYIEECRKSPLQSYEISSQTENKKESHKKQWESQNVRM